MKKVNVKQLAVTLAALALLSAVPFVSAQAQSAKVASLRRDIEGQIPERRGQIAERCEGANPALEVDFESFGDNYEALDNVPYHGLEETAYGVRRFCTDSNNTSEADPAHVGALKSKVKKIVLRFVPKAEQKNISLKAGGVLVIEMAFGVSGGRLDQAEIKERLGEIL